ncbi:MAG TPA: alpha-amylase family glycosyl hydrolase [Opitutaceae bacterium]|nr:alpha-amylase family glycosyl hydrolase [Opitutaceae bacterium]
MSEQGTIFQAWLETPDSGVIELTRDWFGAAPPPLALGRPPRDFKALHAAPPILFSALSGYYVNNRNVLHFVLDTSQLGDIEWQRAGVYVACEASGWGEARKRTKWRMRPVEIGGRTLLDLARPMDGFCKHGRVPFKFLTGDGTWIEPHSDAPNVVRDPTGVRNFEVDPDRTGRHRFTFETEAPLDLSEDLFIVLRDDPEGQLVPLRPDGFFLRMESKARLGAHVDGDETQFRLFAPRARRVWLQVREHVEVAKGMNEYPMDRAEDGTWELRLDANLNGWFYSYRVAGPANAFGEFESMRMIADPYARALVAREGPGIILEDAFFEGADLTFPTPQWHDLVVCEVHLRDLVARAPVKLSAKERRGFRGLAAWVASESFYLRQLGVNAVELQPVQQFDAKTPDEYHWGYMPVNWFSPDSTFADAPADASQVGELRELVRAFHVQGIAVILDVVYNHVGEPAHLLFVDKQYYFETSPGGHLANWSGCGNDLRASSPMAKRMIIESCTHMMTAYGIDGFRFDLAELIGVEPLREIEVALKLVKPDLILIAEPWSFRGHIAGALATTGWSSWNDGYREFMREFIRGHGSRAGLEYFMKGSPWYFAHWPAQTVNYTESHDDRTWIDVITENGDSNGDHPTHNDRLRTHLMCAILMTSIGIPMLAAGQDFLRSKKGVTNTYQRGDLNALDYGRLARFEPTHRYFADWIRFRLSDRGRLFRLYSRPGEGFFAFAFAKDRTATAVVFNADGSHGPQRLLFAVNPHLEDVVIPGDDFPVVIWKQVADAERFFGPEDDAGEPGVLNNGIHLPALGCGLWISG